MSKKVVRFLRGKLASLPQGTVDAPALGVRREEVLLYMRHWSKQAGRPTLHENSSCSFVFRCLPIATNSVWEVEAFRNDRPIISALLKSPADIYDDF